MKARKTTVNKVKQLLNHLLEQPEVFEFNFAQYLSNNKCSNVYSTILFNTGLLRREPNNKYSRTYFKHDINDAVISFFNEWDDYKKKHPSKNKSIREIDKTVAQEIENDCTVQLVNIDDVLKLVEECEKFGITKRREYILSKLTR